jgi:Protein of unknown function (DUF3421)
MKKTLLGILALVVLIIGGLWLWGYKNRLPYNPPVATAESGEISAELRKTLPVELFPATNAPNVLQWIPQQNGAKPPNALSSGAEYMNHNPGSPRTLYVCRAAHGNGVHPGKLVGGACNIGYGGQEIEKRQYEVAAYTGGSWGNRGLNGALVGGYENNQKLYVCRHHLTETVWPNPFSKNDYGWHAGKFLPNTGECHWGYGGKEYSDDEDNEFFYP